MITKILPAVRGYERHIVTTIQELVECESPTDDPKAVNRFVETVADRLSGVASIQTFAGGKFGKHARMVFRMPGPRKKTPGRILALGHSDTVWPMGTLATMPCKVKDGRIWGPGSYDMKAGIAFFLYALRVLRDLDIPVTREVMLQLNSDEEVGSDSSRPLTEDAARGSRAVLVLEPSAGLAGKLKTARKGVGDYRVTVQGKAAHSGVDFGAGASAILEMGRQLERIATFTNLERGITVNPGVIQGGTRSNVIAAECTCEVDVRIPRARNAEYVAKKFATLRPFDKRCSLHVEGGINRPPMERSAGVRELFRNATTIAGQLGFTLEESATGGGSDGNFTAALGVPTLDGLGAVGEGAHAPHESVLLSCIVPRTALLAGLVATL